MQSLKDYVALSNLMSYDISGEPYFGCMMHVCRFPTWFSSHA